MRKISLLLCISLSLLANSIFSQTTGNFNYQAVVRDAEGNLLTNKSLTVQLSIIESTADGDEIYVETHSVTSTNTGIINLLVGDGTASLGNFETINWGENAKFIKIEINAGNALVDMGTFQLFSVPFAHYAMEVENKDDADANPANEIQDISLVGSDLSITGGSTLDLSVIQDGVDDADSDPSNEIQDLNLEGDVLTITNHPSPTPINLSAYTGTNTDEQELSILGDTLYISNGNEVVLPYDSSKWVMNGTTMYYNGGNVGIGSSTPVSNLEVKGTAVTSDALFQVINSNNDTVFAVYPDGVKIFIDSEAKGKVGGFAVSGRSPSKAGDVDIFRATVDSTRIYVSDTVSSKGKVGGFAVSGRSPSKGISNDYLLITGDSTRIYINDTLATKGKVGGFAISGRSPSKGPTNDYLQINRDSTRIYITESATKGKVGGFAISGRSPSKDGYDETDYFNVSGNTSAQRIDPSEARIFWYPKKEAFLTGRVLVENPDSIGTNSMATGFESKAKGDFSQAMGFQSIARGAYSTAIGNQALANDSNSFAFGQWAQARNIESYAFGRGAIAEGFRSYAFGSSAINYEGSTTGVTHASGDYSVAIGQGSQSTGYGSFSLGIANIAAGNYSLAYGYSCSAAYWGSLALGYYCQSNSHLSTAIGLWSISSGDYSTALGFYATASGLSSTSIGVETTASGTGSTALGFGTTASNSGATSIGRDTQASGEYSTAMGFQSIASGFSSTAIGYFTIASGSQSFVVGSYSSASGTGSTSIGLNNIASGESSFAIGQSVVASGDNSTAMGSHTTASGNYSIAMGNHVSTNTYEGTFIFGDASKQYTTDTLKATAINQFMVRAVGGTIFYSNSELTAGVSLSPGGGAWASVSDKNKKENFKDINSEEVLEKLSKINIQSWNYKSQDSAIEHVGITAQDFYKNFGFGENDTTLIWMDVAGVNSIAIQELCNNYKDLKKENEDLKERLTEIEKLLMAK